ncbi:MAG: hypothetical protein Q9162_005004 [Coniocarpon cinnabarinum]
MMISFLLQAVLVAAFPLQQQRLFSNSIEIDATNRIPTPFESAIQARRILSNERYAVLSTIYPSTRPSLNTFDSASDAGTLENRPDTVAGLPVGLPEYIADCEDTGSPTLLAISISTSAKNWASGSNVSLAVTSHAPTGQDWESQAAHPRYTLLGYVEPMTDTAVKEKNIEECFLKRHEDAESWLPGNEIHESYWARMVVKEVYWIGGFGDRAYIGWISGDDWRRAGESILQPEMSPDYH